MKVYGIYIDREIEIEEREDKMSIIPHKTLEALADEFGVIYDFELLLANGYTAAFKCTAEFTCTTASGETIKRRAVQIGESSKSNLVTEISKQYPLIMASKRAFDRTMIRLFGFTGGYSDTEIETSSPVKKTAAEATKTPSAPAAKPTTTTRTTSRRAMPASSEPPVSIFEEKPVVAPTEEAIAKTTTTPSAEPDPVAKTSEMPEFASEEYSLDSDYSELLAAPVETKTEENVPVEKPSVEETVDGVSVETSKPNEVQPTEDTASAVPSVEEPVKEETPSETVETAETIVDNSVESVAETPMTEAAAPAMTEVEAPTEITETAVESVKEAAEEVTANEEPNASVGETSEDEIDAEEKVFEEDVEEHPDFLDALIVIGRLKSQSLTMKEGYMKSPDAIKWISNNTGDGEPYTSQRENAKKTLQYMQEKKGLKA